MELTWKDNWSESRQHLVDWWNHTGMVLSAASPLFNPSPHADLPLFQRPEDDIVRFYSDPGYHARCEHHRLAETFFGGDILPIASTDIGPGSLALYLGSEPKLTIDTVWFDPCPGPIDQAIRLDPGNRWWQVTRATIQACLEKGRGQYLVGCPDLIENIDILASLWGSVAMLVELIEHPDIVLARLHEINQAWFEVYTQIYDLIRLEDGSAAFGAFSLWGPGKTAKLQCDASAMLSPAMFRRFVKPFLQEQCEWLDFSMFHLDGHQCIPHLDALLEIEALDAIEWTADPIVPSGGDPSWYPLIRRILEHGKSVQLVDVKPDDVQPLLDQVGAKGLYLFVKVSNQAEFESIQALRKVYLP